MSRYYFVTPLAASGIVTAIPVSVQVDGSLSYTAGWGANYTMDPAGGDPPALQIDEGQFNQLFNDVTAAIQALQQHYAPDFITTSDNGGTPFSYSLGDIVYLSGVYYQSNVNSNTDTPPTSKWNTLPLLGSSQLPMATAGGTANAVTATFSPALTTLAASQLVMVRSAAINTNSMTFNPNGLGAKSIYKGNNQAISPGDVPANSWMLLQRDTSLDKWQLLNPRLPAGLIPLDILDTTIGQNDAWAVQDAISTINPAPIASASSVDLAGIGAGTIYISGTTTINSFSFGTVGCRRTLIFQGALTLTNSSVLVCLGGANVTTAAGDVAEFQCTTTSHWTMLRYQRNVAP